MIEIRDVHKRFNPGSVNEVYALRGLSLDIPAGQFVTVIGTNGSGKSTLLNALAGEFAPDTGSVFIAGRDVTAAKEHERARLVARVFQNPFMGTVPGMSIAENLHMASLRGNTALPRLGLNRSHRQQYRERIRALEMGLEDRMDNAIGSLSGGQRQALTLLMAVINTPQVLLLDEHTAALDPKSAAQVIKLTQQFVARMGLTTLMVTHSMRQALDLGERTVMMHRGQVIEDIPLAEKRRLTTEDLLERFAELRKGELLNEELLEELRRGYA
ncbi:MAG: ATP-binding cassette domain-containing protein [Pseudomonadota bacterium]